MIDLQTLLMLTVIFSFYTDLCDYKFIYRINSLQEDEDGDTQFFSDCFSSLLLELAFVHNF